MRAVRFYQLNLGGCSLCTQTLFWLRYGSAPYGRFRCEWVGLPELADAILVTGYLTAHNLDLLLQLKDHLPKEAVVISLGDCSCRGGPFSRGETTMGPVDRHITVHLRIEGCGNAPDALMAAVERTLRSWPKGAIGS